LLMSKPNFPWSFPSKNIFFSQLRGVVAIAELKLIFKGNKLYDNNMNKAKEILRL
jgi:hypothetical protein